MCLNHPETIPSSTMPPALSMEKFSSTKLIPGTRKVGEQCVLLFYFYLESVWLLMGFLLFVLQTSFVLGFSWHKKHYLGLCS